jgi:hypothetical protein
MSPNEGYRGEAGVRGPNGKYKLRAKAVRLKLTAKI